MDKRKILATAVSVVLAFSFYTVYTSTIIYWDGFALEIDPIEGFDLEYTIQYTAEDLDDYPLVMSTLETVDQNGNTVITVDDWDTMQQFIEFNEANEGTLDDGYVFLQGETGEYMVSKVSYGGMDDQPIYLYMSGLMTLVAVGLVLSELLGYMRQRKEN